MSADAIGLPQVAVTLHRTHGPERRKPLENVQYASLGPLRHYFLLPNETYFEWGQPYSIEMVVRPAVEAS